MDASTRRRVVAHCKRHTLVVGGIATLALTVGATELLGVPGRDALGFQAVLAAALVLVPFAVSDAGLESAGVGVAGGFDVTNPSQYRAGSDGPLRVKAAFAFAGVLAYSLLGFAVLSVL
jgi:hypothetical protein